MPGKQGQENTKDDDSEDDDDDDNNNQVGVSSLILCKILSFVWDYLLVGVTALGPSPWNRFLNYCDILIIQIIMEICCCAKVGRHDKLLVGRKLKLVILRGGGGGD